MKKLYVGNLSYQTAEQDLQDLFGQYGSVASATIIMDKMSGRSKGFGFVEMDDADAQKAIDGLNGKDFQGRPLTVNEARPREEGPRRGGDRGGRQDRRSW